MAVSKIGWTVLEKNWIEEGLIVEETGPDKTYFQLNFDMNRTDAETMIECQVGAKQVEDFTYEEAVHLNNLLKENHKAMERWKKLAGRCETCFGS